MEGRRSFDQARRGWIVDGTRAVPTLHASEEVSLPLSRIEGLAGTIRRSSRRHAGLQVGPAAAAQEPSDAQGSRRAQ